VGVPLQEVSAPHGGDARRRQIELPTGKLRPDESVAGQSGRIEPRG
jgi:hypothetical protein